MAKRQNRQEWQRTIAAWKRSGLVPREFFEQRGLNPRTFSWWRWRLGQTKGKPVETPGKSSKTPVEKPAENAAFVEVALKAPVATPRIVDLEVRIGPDIAIRVPKGFDRKTLVGVVDALLEAQAC